MWKLMGVAILTGSGLWLGLQAAGQLARRVRAIESWQCALLLLEGEMSFRLPDLPQLLEEVGRGAKKRAGRTWYYLGRYLYVPCAVILCAVALILKVAF